MKVGILGQHSYICKRFAAYVSCADMQIVSIDCRNGAWRSADFSAYDVLLCPIGIAHVSADPRMEARYYAVNRDLPIALAKKAKTDGVGQFVFFSSMIVYGADKPVGQEYIITADTEPAPENFYGKSKLEAEGALRALSDQHFVVTILRLPMVYGPGCKGNFPQLLKVARKSPFCPLIQNQRSMIYIDNLCEYLCFVIDNRTDGVFFPQNTEYVSTTAIIKTAAKYFKHKLCFVRAFNPMIRLLGKHLAVVNKVFGTKVYDFSLSPDRESYNKVDFETSIQRCVEACL